MLSMIFGDSYADSADRVPRRVGAGPTAILLVYSVAMWGARVAQSNGSASDSSRYWRTQNENA